MAMAHAKCKGKMKQAISIILLLVIFCSVGSVIWQHSESYTSQNFWQTLPQLKIAYDNSQYVTKHSKAWIPDETLNAYAGGAYVQGMQPQFIDPSAPPLGRYLIGLSAIIFHNPNEFNLLSAIMSLVGIFLVGKQILQKTYLALMPVAAFSLEPIFKNQLIYTPLLDIMQLFFLIFAFYFFNKSYNAKKYIIYYILTSICVGCFIATKFFITGLTIIGACFLVLLFHKQIKKTIFFLLTTIISVVILLLSYIRALFSTEYTVKSFLGIQKYVFLYHKSQLILPFSVWPLLFLNRWYVWFGNKPVISDNQWAFTWPIIAGLSFLTIIFYVFRKIKRNKNVEALMIWIVLYILFFSFGEIASRYFVIYIPILYIVSLFGIVSVVKHFYENRT